MTFKQVGGTPAVLTAESEQGRRGGRQTGGGALTSAAKRVSPQRRGRRPRGTSLTCGDGLSPACRAACSCCSWECSSEMRSWFSLRGQWADRSEVASESHSHTHRYTDRHTQLAVLLLPRIHPTHNARRHQSSQTPPPRAQAGRHTLSTLQSGRSCPHETPAPPGAKRGGTHICTGNLTHSKPFTAGKPSETAFGPNNGF